MKELKLYYGMSPVRCEGCIIISYAILYLLFCTFHIVYQPRTLMNVFVIVGYIYGAQNIYRANKTAECSYKFFRMQPDGWKRYRNAYVSLAVIGVLRPIYLTLLTLAINFIPYLGDRTQNQYLAGNLIYNSILIAGFLLITGRNVKEILYSVFIEVFLMLVYLFHEEFFETNPTGIVLAVISIAVFVLGAIAYHLHTAYKIWHKVQE